jgi:hypothetical protein
MNNVTQALIERTARWSLALRVVLLIVIAALAFAAVAAWRYSQVGPMGIWAAAVATAICLAGAAAALVATGLFRGAGPHGAVSGMMLGMLFRMGLPLGALMAFQQNGGALVEAGIVGCLLLVYPVTLLAEVALAVSLLQPPESSRQA